jgi:hypothetical protein
VDREVVGGPRQLWPGTRRFADSLPSRGRQDSIAATDSISAVYSGYGNFNPGAAPNVSAVAVSNVASGVYTIAASEIVQLYGTALSTQTLSGFLPRLGGVTVTVRSIS